MTQTQAIDIGAGQYVLITLHDEYLLACKGQSQVRGTLTMGTYYVNLGLHSYWIFDFNMV